jgi:hypothetical protein
MLHRLLRLEDLGVRVEGDLVVGAHGLAERAEILGRRAHHLAPAVGVHVDAVGAELERGQAPLAVQPVELVARGSGVRCGIDAGIDPHLVARIAAEQHVDRQADGLRRDVPQAMVDCRDPAEAEGARREARLLDEQVDQELDPPRVVPLDEAEEVVEQRKVRLVRPVVVALAPAGQPVVGIDRDEDARPVLVARHERAQAVDFHDRSPGLK